MKQLKFYLIALLIFILDQAGKAYFKGKSFSVIGDFFKVTYVENRGAAFGILQGQRTFFIILSLVVLCFAIYYLFKVEDNKIKLSLSFFLGGIIGNLFDRIYLGFVIDFLDFGIGALRWPAFNFADISSVVAVFMLIFLLKDE